MAQSTLDMMVVRRAALDAMADLPGPIPGDRAFADIQVDLARHLPAGAATRIPPSLVKMIADRLVRDDGTGGAGAAVVTGLSRRFELPAAREFHQDLFALVWEEFRHRTGADGPAGHYRSKAGTTSDGAIPLRLYGSEWSFKQLHMDRDALLFSHLYGPAAGFTGGSLLLADVRTYMRRHLLRFDDLFDWSEESTPGSKPVLRAVREDDVMGECGIDLGVVGADEIVFVNNSPSAGVVHGVTPVAVTDRDTFVRVFHRCSVRRENGAVR